MEREQILKKMKEKNQEGFVRMRTATLLSAVIQILHEKGIVTEEEFESIKERMEDEYIRLLKEKIKKAKEEGENE